MVLTLSQTTVVSVSEKNLKFKVPVDIGHKWVRRRLNCIWAYLWMKLNLSDVFGVLKKAVKYALLGRKEFTWLVRPDRSVQNVT